MRRFGYVAGAARVALLLSAALPGIAGASPSLTTLFSFTDPASGQTPLGALVFDGAGALYGVTQFNSIGAGEAFQLRPPAAPGEDWVFNVLWTFGAAGDAAHPIGGLAFGKPGTLYGTGFDGGASDTGTVFSLTRPKT